MWAFFVLTSLIFLFGQQVQAETIVVSASVAPSRIVVVNEKMAVQQVFSNTSEDVVPTVLLKNIEGRQIAYSENVAEQYESLKPSLDFSKPGEVYRAESDNLWSWLLSHTLFLWPLAQDTLSSMKSLFQSA